MKKIISLLTLFSCSIYAGEAQKYIFLEGDTLSDVLYTKFKLQPVYGRNGFIKKILDYNPDLKNKIIFPGDFILIPNYMLEQNQQEQTVETRHAPKKVQVTDRVVAEVLSDPKLEKEKEKDDFKQSFYWRAAPAVSWKSLSSTDTNIYRSSQISALSNTSYGMSFSYGMHFEDNMDVYSELSLESVSFVEDNLINLLRKKFMASSLSVGLAYERRFIFNLGMTDEFFLTSPNLSNVEIKKVTLPELKSTYLKDFYKYKEASLSGGLSVKVILPRASGEVKSKLSYGAGASLKAKLQNQSFDLGFDLNFLKAEGNSTNSQNIYWKYTWDSQ